MTTTTTTTLTIAPNPVVFGAATTLTAAIAPIPTGCSPLGSVSFYDGATLLGTGTVNGSGVADTFGEATWLLASTASSRSIPATLRGCTVRFLRR